MRERRGATPPSPRSGGMRIGIVCYASVGGSGVVATELATSLARRGHEVHVLSSEIPFRLRDARGPVVVHAIETPAYPLFREPQYVLSLSTKIVNVARAHALDIIHAHYAVPHAAGAYLARQILASHGAAVPKVVTTLHGTDITLVGADPSYRETVAFCIEQSDGVTAVSESLRDDTYRHLRLTSPIVVVPNFLDCGRYTPMPDPALRARHCPPDRYDSLLLHVSNFRPVKRLDSVVEVFRRVREQRRAKIVLVGDGPERGRVETLAREAGIAEHVEILGELDDVRGLLSVADAFLLPSAQESFGLAALEAMACGVPVVASRVGGLPEVITDGLTGYLRDPDEHAGMAAAVLDLLDDPSLRQRIAHLARASVVDRFDEDRVVPMYEALYERLLTVPAAGSRA
jgi:L-malate glycosyltransferase